MGQDTAGAEVARPPRPGVRDSLRDATGNFPQNPAMALRPGTVIIKTETIPIQDIGTDPKFIQNFDILVKPGTFAQLLGVDPAVGVPRAALLGAASRNIIARKLIESGLTPGTPPFNNRLAELNSFHRGDAIPALNGQGYKARPLNGAWATSPYLHNGSVPNMDQLLRPAAQRVRKFHVGSTHYDPKHLGLDSRAGEGTFEFRTVDDAGQPIPGNSNAGHSGPRYTQTKGADGTFRDYTDLERSQLIEFIKTLK
jgi:hypothetical protein